MALWYLLLVAFYVLGVADGWDYREQGRDWRWQCRHYAQSPIDIDVDDTVYDASMRALVFENYNMAGYLLSMRNNGHTAQLLVEARRGHSRPMLSGGLLAPGHKYVLESVKFTWGAGLQGSEHLVSGQRAGMELHFIHRNLRYPDMRSAVKHADGFAVVAVLLDVRAGGDRSRAMSQIQQALPFITNMRRRKHRLGAFALNQLLPHLPHRLATDHFYQYNGSFSAPPCQESVSWIILAHRRIISARQIATFRTLQDRSRNSISSNFRGEVARNRRKIARSYQIASSSLLPRASWANLFTCTIGLLLKLLASSL